MDKVGGDVLRLGNRRVVKWVLVEEDIPSGFDGTGFAPVIALQERYKSDQLRHSQ